MVAELKMNQEKLKMLQAQVRIGGKGTVRRKKKVVHRTATTDDKKLQSSLKKLSGDKLQCLLSPSSIIPFCIFDPQRHECDGYNTS